MKTRAAASTHKKVIVTFSDHTTLQGYLNPLRLPDDPLDVLTTNGEHREVPLKEIRAGLKFRDNETLEGVVSNDLLALLDSGIQITPPDLNGASMRIFVPRNALSEVTVLGVVGVARRKPAVAAPAQPKLFSE